MICRSRVRTPWAKLLLFVLAQLRLRDVSHAQKQRKSKQVVKLISCRVENVESPPSRSPSSKAILRPGAPNGGAPGPAP